MRFILFVYIYFIPQALIAQGISNLWLFGYANPSGPPWGGGVMDFSQGYFQAYPQSRILNINTTNANISDSTGKFLFASNGIFIQNAVNDTMANGNDLNPGYFVNARLNYGLSIPQANLIIPFPNDKSKFYLFHETLDDYPWDYNTLNLFYSIIDMSLQGGLGEVIQKNTILLSDSLVPGRLTACKHANGRDWWIIAHGLWNNLYYKYLITSTGIQGPFTQNIGAMRRNFVGQCVFSPNGKYFAYYEPHQGDLDIFEFDRCSGDFIINANVPINDSAFGGGVAFSPNSNVLYVSSMNYVYQFDMTAADIAASKFTVGVWDGFFSYGPPLSTSFYLSYLAPDGKIYINCGNGTSHIHVINQPDSLGHASALCQHCIHLPVRNAFTIPNHPNYFLGAEVGTLCDSLGVGVSKQQDSKLIAIYPNPVTGNEITISHSVSNSSQELYIFDAHGRLLYNISLPPWTSIHRIVLPEISEGIYIAKLGSASLKFNVLK